jgi:hypothetical protein
MPEGHNVEIAHSLSEHDRAPGEKRRWEEVVEVVEVALLAIVAILTAWSGYQAAKWDGHQSLLYGHANRDRFAADAATTRGGQVLLGDVTNFDAWLQAHASGDRHLQFLFERRFTPEYHTAFEAWLRTDPFTNKDAPAGPGYMPQYRNPLWVRAARLNHEASEAFDQGTEARETADKYVRGSVLFASVLFLIAIAQRFKLRPARITANLAAGCLLLFTVYTVFSLQRM